MTSFRGLPGLKSSRILILSGGPRRGGNWGKRLTLGHATCGGSFFAIGVGVHRFVLRHWNNVRGAAFQDQYRFRNAERGRASLTSFSESGLAESARRAKAPRLGGREGELSRLRARRLGRADQGDQRIGERIRPAKATAGLRRCCAGQDKGRMEHPRRGHPQLYAIAPR
jgi:hypothetical protein